jgi:hypothetical protein
MNVRLTTEVLEQLLDTHGVQAVCEDLAKVCYDKEQHVSENWQDTALATLWNEFGNRFDEIANEARKTGHPSFARKTVNA